jgi:hypothetical protein
MFMNSTCGLDGKPCHGEDPITDDSPSAISTPDVAMEGVARYKANFYSQTVFYERAANGTLPALSWVHPPIQARTHLPAASPPRAAVLTCPRRPSRHATTRAMTWPRASGCSRTCTRRCVPRPSGTRPSSLSRTMTRAGTTIIWCRRTRACPLTSRRATSPASTPSAAAPFDFRRRHTSSPHLISTPHVHTSGSQVRSGHTHVHAPSSHTLLTPPVHRCGQVFDFRRLGLRTSAMLISPWYASRDPTHDLSSLLKLQTASSPRAAAACAAEASTPPLGSSRCPSAALDPSSCRVAKGTVFQKPRGPTSTSQFELSSVASTVQTLRLTVPALCTAALHSSHWGVCGCVCTAGQDPLQPLLLPHQA